MKNNAVFFMRPAWDCNSWAAEGSDVRPYSDLGLKGKFIKASVPVRESWAVRAAERIPARILRTAASWSGSTRLHYRLLQPNYKDYWEADSDALNDIDRNEAMLWFRSRGDECLNCQGLAGSPLMKRLRLSNSDSQVDYRAVRADSSQKRDLTASPADAPKKFSREELPPSDTPVVDSLPFSA